MVRIVSAAVFFLCIVPWLQGCTYQAWYAGLQEKQRQDCYAHAGSSDTARCLDNANSVSYDVYAAQRSQGQTGPAK